MIIGLVTLFSLFALWLRLIPMFMMGNTDILMMVGSDDPLYNLRQIEQMLANNLAYAWFDPMTLYPSGSTTYWGPLFPMIIAICCMITGATTRPEIIGVGLLIPAIMAVAIVAIMYWVGMTCGDWKTGLLASGFMAIVTGQFFYRSFYGYMDHHIAEVLFSTLFCVFFMYALLSEKETIIDLKNIHTYKKTVVFSVLAGIAYLLGLFAMPTMILFAMIVAIFTVVQFIIDVYRNRSSKYFLIINTVTFSIAIIGLLVFGFKSEGINLSDYSIGHIYAYLGLIGGTYLLYLLASYLKGKQKYYYPAALAAIAVLFASVLYLVSPQIYNLLIYSFFSFFGQNPFINTVQEARGWSLDLAWITFNYGIILMLGGALVLFYNNVKEEHPHQVFTLVWSIFMVFSTWQHIRYEYYLAVNIALLSAVCLTFSFERGWSDIFQMTTWISPDSEVSDNTPDATMDARKTKRGKKDQKKPSKSPTYDYFSIGLVVITIGLSILFIYTSVSFSYNNASSNAIRMNGDWKESLEWMANNTPDTGVNYFTIYDRKTFTYPNQSYGVMSWWDYGHMITYIAKRIPNANPFQSGVAGPNGAAAYFMVESEDMANEIADTVGTRYVITDIEMDTGKFWAMATWFNSSVSTQPYQTQFVVTDPAQPDLYQQVILNNQSYYLTMVSRLHNFDGSMTDPQKVYYVEYVDPSVARVSVPVITNAVAMNASESLIRAVQYNLKAPEGYHAATYSPAIHLPIEHVPALRHYRLVHESPTNVFAAKTPDIKYVKIFEYVKGAHIRGEGVIEIPLVSPTGRQFTYRQQSTNGEFIVPYSTTGNPYGVKSLGKYRIVNSKKEFDVPEDAVMRGLNIN